ncbi:hypothetical protein RJ55_04588 [Drechmeria coniospora]|nr:hypothetical protein RJ55_04588 [Drechmeria coniospora]
MNKAVFDFLRFKENATAIDNTAAQTLAAAVLGSLFAMAVPGMDKVEVLASWGSAFNSTFPPPSGSVQMPDVGSQLWLLPDAMLPHPDVEKTGRLGVKPMQTRVEE